jgi:hypothetical protein
MEFKFKNIKITEYEKFWLEEIVSRIYSCRGSSSHDYKKKIETCLKEFKSKGFDESKINKLLFKDNHITLLGLWYIYPQDKVFENINKIISRVKQIIHENSKNNNKNDEYLKAKDLVNVLGLPEYAYFGLTGRLFRF